MKQNNSGIFESLNEAQSLARDLSREIEGMAYSVWQVGANSFAVYNTQSPGPLKGVVVSHWKNGKSAPELA